MEEQIIQIQTDPQGFIYGLGEFGNLYFWGSLPNPVYKEAQPLGEGESDPRSEDERREFNMGWILQKNRLLYPNPIINQSEIDQMRSEDKNK